LVIAVVLNLALFVLLLGYTAVQNQLGQLGLADRA
jgi:hypothetical protein